MIQPFIDGVSSRRTSVMAALAHGLPIVTTTGPLTESLWEEKGAVLLAPSDDVNAQAKATEQLLTNAEQRRELGLAALKFYDEHFDIQYSIAALREVK
jgi:glycosyltransferase involved in cell wall biosynthesis